jgi:hypothetical protein
MVLMAFYLSLSKSEIMKQRKLLQELYKACLTQNNKKIAEIQSEEFRKIFKHRDKGKPFGAKWTIVNI